MPTEAIDLCIGWGPFPDEPFVHFIRRHCELRRLRSVVCRDDNIQPLIRNVEKGRRRIGLYLDAQADYEDTSDPYSRLGFAAKDGGSFVVNEPEHTKRSVNKAVIHYDLVRADIPVPYTVVVRNWEPGKFALTPQERRKLGRPFIIKPARGYGKQGVARVEGGTLREIARARRFDRGDDFLLQKLIEPTWCGARRAWFRAYVVLGQVILCWWDNVTQHYAGVTSRQFEEYELAPLCRIVLKIARMTHMNFFSSEIAARGTGARRRFTLIDYVNDQCDMTMQSHSHCGLPDDIVQHIAQRFVDAAWRIRKDLDPVEAEHIWFPDKA